MNNSRREELRRRAEALVSSAKITSIRPNDSVESLLHDLAVYEEELEIQNDELRAAQTDLLVSQRRFAELFEDAPIPYFVLDDEGSIRELNARAEALLGRSRAWLHGKPLISWLATESHQPFALHRTDTVRGGEPTRVEVVFETRSALGPQRRRMLLDSRRVSDPANKGGRLLTAAMDVTDLREAEAQRRRAVARYTNLLEHSRDATFVLNGRGELVDTNPAACRLLGRDHAELVEMPFANLAAPGYHQQVLELLTRDQPGLNELSLLGAGGELVWVEVSVSRLDEQGGGRLIVARDLTDRRAARAERERIEAEAGKIQRLDALGRLAGGVAHDVNDVLSAVLTIGALLHEDESTDERREHLAMLLSAAQRGADLTKRLLAFARGEQTSKAPVSMGRLCREVVTSIGRKTEASGAGVQVDLDLDEDADLVVHGDAGALEQVLTNLCENSLEAMPDGGTLRVSAHALSGFVDVRVQDTGKGMDARTAAHAFDPFFSTKPKGKGDGLGLAMVYGTVKKHGGSVALESVPETGTTVIITLPRALGRHAPPVESHAPAAELHGHCLVVDDDPMVRHATASMLKRLNLEVTTANGGVEASKLLDEGKTWDLYMLDLDMPQVDGVTLVKRIFEHHPEARVLFCSGYSAEGIPQKILDRPGVRFLGKPFSKTELKRVLSTLLG